MQLWGGFIDNKLDVRWINDGWGGEHYRWIPALFLTRKEAQAQYEDVRKIEVPGRMTTDRVRG